MKKTYSIPTTRVVTIQATAIIAASGIATDKSMGFGSNAGADEEGDARYDNGWNIWGDE
ncbi:MAG: hypothetical protein IJT19_04590 [Bacteroidaceae bacterium]|nr:hypothetical protein [Bacteroidaceae bacterium]